MGYDLITVGRVTMDLFARDIGAPFEEVSGFDTSVGGSPTNVAIAAARLGLRAIAFTGVGDDHVAPVIERDRRRSDHPEVTRARDLVRHHQLGDGLRPPAGVRTCS